MKRKGITARLAKPSSRRIGLLMDEAQAHEQREQWVLEDLAQMELLREQYGIPDDSLKWYMLALELARETYPKPLKRGPKTKWNEFVCGILVVEVERLISSERKSLNWVYKTLGNRPRWSQFVIKKENTLGSKEYSIEDIYKAHKNRRGTKLMRDAFKFHQQKGTIDQWERQVDQFLAKPLIGDDFPD